VHDVTVPALGMAMTEAVLTRWHKHPGDVVSVGEVLAEIETDKSNVDLTAPVAGVLGAHLVHEGATVPVGGAVVRVLQAGESERVDSAGAPPLGAQPGVEAPEMSSPDVADQLEAGAAADLTVAHATSASDYSPPARAPHRLSPRKRRLARLEAEAEAFQAVTMEGGPTQAREAAAARASEPSPSPSSGGKLRGIIAERVSQSWLSIPHFAVQAELDAGDADSCLARIRERDPDATFTDLLMRAFALAVAGLVPSAVDIGLAVSTPAGVMLPVVARVPDLDVSALVTQRAAAVRRGRAAKLSLHDLNSTPVGSLSNLGARGVDSFTGIIPFGQRLLLTVGRVAARPAVVDGRLAVRTTVVATLNVDHRHFDGDQAAQVLAAFGRELGTLRAWAEGGRT
jgi:pyruvate dehydrogenase E2 component (dihydrolipoamide acetyltransferase)